MKKKCINDHIRRKLSLILILVLSVLMISCGQKETDVASEDNTSEQDPKPEVAPEWKPETYYEKHRMET